MPDLQVPSPDAKFGLEISSPAAPETEPPPDVGCFFGGEVGTVGYLSA